MKFLIAGLGNIGQEYEHTRHNVGFEVLDHYANASGISFSVDRYASIAEHKHRGKQLVFIKPSTYMNLSGKAINYWLQKAQIPFENLLVITDDLALPFGQIRLRAKGSDGGHNGLKNINETLGHSNYARLRFGIGSDFSKGKQVDYVLEQWNATELELLGPKLKLCGEIINSFVHAGVNRTMSDFNKRSSD